jgi:hypothetical protein
MKTKKYSWCLVALLGLAAFASVVIAAPGAIYQDALRSYNTAHSVFLNHRAAHRRTGSSDDLVATVNAAAVVLEQRDLVMVTYIDLLEETVQQRLQALPQEQEQFLTQLAQFRVQFQARLNQEEVVQNVVSWYSSDADFGSIKQHFNILAFQIFTTICSHEISNLLTEYQRLHDEQSSSILARADSEIARASRQRELVRLVGILDNLQERFAVLAAQGEQIRTEAQYDAWKAEADLFLSQLIRNIRDFNQLWAT